MEALLSAYNKKLESISEFYSTLNSEIEYEPGKTTSLGIVFRGRAEHLPDLNKASRRMVDKGINDFCALHEYVRTPSKIKGLASLIKISEKTMRILAHDLNMWMPQRVKLSFMPFLRDSKEDLRKLYDYGIEDQISFLSGYYKKSKRKDLSKDLKIKFDVMNEYIKICDFFRMGVKSDAVRPVIYYKMGYDTHRKWADAIPKDITGSFEQYLKKNKLESQFMTPFTKELVNGIEWAKVHHSLFKVEY